MLDGSVGTPVARAEFVDSLLAEVSGDEVLIPFMVFLYLVDTVLLFV